MLSIASSACPALPPAFGVGSVSFGRLAVGDYEVVLHGPGSGLWCQGVRLGDPVCCWPRSVISEGSEIGGWMLRHPGSAALLSIEVRSLMALGPGWLGGRLLARGYSLGSPDCAKGLSGLMWQCWLQRVAVTPQGVLKARSPEAARALKTPVWQEVAHVRA